MVKYWKCFPIILIWNISLSQPTSSVARWCVSTICHHGAPIRAPKPEYIPLQQPNLAQPLSKRLNTGSAFQLFSYETFVYLNPPRLWPGDVYQPSVTMGAPSEPPNQNTNPCTNPILLSLFLRGWILEVLSNYSHMKHLFISTHLVCGQVMCISHLSPWGPHQSPQTRIHISF